MANLSFAMVIEECYRYKEFISKGAYPSWSRGFSALPLAVSGVSGGSPRSALLTHALKENDISLRVLE